MRFDRPARWALSSHVQRGHQSARSRVLPMRRFTLATRTRLWFDRLTGRAHLGASCSTASNQLRVRPRARRSSGPALRRKRPRALCFRGDHEVLRDLPVLVAALHHGACQHVDVALLAMTGTISPRSLVVAAVRRIDALGRADPRTGQTRRERGSQGRDYLVLLPDAKTGTASGRRGDRLPHAEPATATAECGSPRAPRRFHGVGSECDQTRTKHRGDRVDQATASSTHRTLRAQRTTRTGCPHGTRERRQGFGEPEFSCFARCFAPPQPRAVTSPYSNRAALPGLCASLLRCPAQSPPPARIEPRG
jgi:hypothetical protein